LQAALALDQKFQLRERLTTALSLDEQVRQSEIGQALISDANSKAEKLVVPQQFPVRLTPRAWWIPAQGIALLLIVWLYHPQPATSNTQEKSTGKEVVEAKKINEATEKLNATRPPMKKMPDRKNRSEELKALEAELEKLFGEIKAKTEEKKLEEIRAKAEQAASTEEKLKKFINEQTEKLNQLQDQLSKMDRQETDKSEGFDKDFREALSKGDLNKAKEEIEGLKKKALEKNLTEEERKDLEKQLGALVEKLDKMAKNDKEQKKLKDLIAQAKKEGRDAEALERALKNLQEQAAKHRELQEFAKKAGECKKCLEQKDFEGLSEKLGELSKQLDQLGDDVQDLSEAEEHLQNLKKLRDSLCKACEGECEGDGKPGERDYAKGKGVASGKRDENPDAQTNSEEARQPGLFDTRGKKRYGGSIDGPAFTKRTSVEMAGEIQEAVQQGGEAMDVQRLRKSDQQAVKEYFERLGKQSPK
jgi:DNA repair exonuclease SbcCD ATPase subunit